MKNLKFSINHLFVNFSILTFCCFAAGTSENISGKVEMPIDLETLLDIRVAVASKKNENIKDAPGIISVVTQDELKRLGATTLREALLHCVPSTGIATTALTSRSLLVMRGDNIKVNSSHILFLIDGRPIREVQEGGVNADFYESFPINCIEQIEVIRGPGSVLYGSDAFSGVINVKTKKPANEGVVASATGYYMPKDGGGTMGEVMFKRGDLNVIAAARYYKMPDWTPEYRHLFMDWDHPELGALDTLADSDTIWDQGPGYLLNLNYRGLSATTSFTQWTSFAFQIKCRVTDRKYFGNIAYNTNILDWWKTEVNFTGTRSELSTELPDVVNPEFVNRHSNNLLLENTHFVSLGDYLNIVAGGTVNYIKGYEMGTNDLTYTIPLFLVSKGNRWAFSGYSQIDYSPVDPLKFIGGIQANKTRGIKQHIAPRIGGIWHPHKNISIKSFYSEAFRLPTINELFMDFVIGLYGNEELKSEIVKTWDQNISFQNDRLMFGATWFYSKMTDIIQQAWAPDLGWWEKRYQNVDEFTFSGVEIEGKWYVTKDLFINGSMLYQDNFKTKSHTYDSIPFPNFIAKGGVSYSNNQGITIGLSNTYQGHTPQQFQDKINKKDQSSFNRINLASRFELARLFNFNSKIAPSILFKIDNILGNEQLMWEYGGFLGAAIPTLRGRTFYLGCNLAL